MDIKTTFLNGYLNEVYMKQSKRFILLENENKVCKLKKSLKWAPKWWHENIDSTIVSYDFIN